MREIIEKLSGIKLNDFPDSDYDKIEELTKSNEDVEVWLLRGMGRYYLSGFTKTKSNNSSLPIQKKICVIKK